MKLVFWALLVCVGLQHFNSQASAVDEGDLLDQIPTQRFARAVAPIKMKVLEPHENREVIYEGYPLEQVLNYLFGDKWKKKDLVLFVCYDGYRSSVPVTHIKEMPAILAYKKFDVLGHEERFVLNNQDQHEDGIRLDPYYLVWDNENQPDLRNEGGAYWPYQIVYLELWDYKQLYKKALPLPGADSDVQKGFELFQKYCITCHQINGDGGEKGGELISTQIIKNSTDTWLAKWIDDPESMKPDTTMPPLNKQLHHRAGAIQEIIAYLRAMSEKLVHF